MNNSENVETFEEQSYKPEEENNVDPDLEYPLIYLRQKSHFKFESLISNKILRCRSIFSIYSKLVMELHHLYILIKKTF